MLRPYGIPWGCINNYAKRTISRLARHMPKGWQMTVPLPVLAENPSCCRYLELPSESHHPRGQTSSTRCAALFQSTSHGPQIGISVQRWTWSNSIGARGTVSRRQSALADAGWNQNADWGSGLSTLIVRRPRESSMNKTGIARYWRGSSNRNIEDGVMDCERLCDG